MGHPLWPLFDLRLVAGDLALRLPTDDELATLCQLARAGIHPPDDMPFAFPWSVKPSPEFERGFAQLCVRRASHGRTPNPGRGRGGDAASDTPSGGVAVPRMPPAISRVGR